jgi:hypothetical protein
MDPHDAAVEAARLAMIESLRDCFGQPFVKIDVQRFRDAVRAGIVAFEACNPARHGRPQPRSSVAYPTQKSARIARPRRLLPELLGEPSRDPSATRLVALCRAASSSCSSSR